MSVRDNLTPLFFTALSDSAAATGAATNDSDVDEEIDGDDVEVQGSHPPT